MTYFTEEEEELGSLFMQIGIKKNAAKVLVFLANSSEATSHAIERGTDLRQPEVSLAMRYLMDQGWIMSGRARPRARDDRSRSTRLQSPSQISWIVSKRRITKKPPISSNSSRNYGITFINPQTTETCFLVIYFYQNRTFNCYKRKTWQSASFHLISIKGTTQYLKF